MKRVLSPALLLIGWYSPFLVRLLRFRHEECDGWVRVKISEPITGLGKAFGEFGWEKNNAVHVCESHCIKSLFESVNDGESSSVSVSMI